MRRLLSQNLHATTLDATTLDATTLDADATATLEQRLAVALELNPQVALRPEPFGALAYNYGNRRLVFLKHLDMVTVARSLGDHPSLRAALQACDIAPHRWPSFATAFESLKSSEVVRER